MKIASLTYKYDTKRKTYGRTLTNWARAVDKERSIPADFLHFFRAVISFSIFFSFSTFFVFSTRLSLLQKNDGSGLEPRPKQLLSVSFFSFVSQSHNFFLIFVDLSNSIWLSLHRGSFHFLDHLPFKRLTPY